MKADVGALKTDVKALRLDVATLNTNVAVILSNYTTKADLMRLENLMMKLGFGAIVALASIVMAAAKFIR